MKIHYDIFRKLCSNDCYTALSRNMSSYELVATVLNDLAFYANPEINNEVSEMIVGLWKDFKEHKNERDFNSDYQRPLEHFERIRTIKVRIAGHKRKYVHCDVTDPIYRKRAPLIRILKEKRTGHLEDGAEYALDLVEIKAGAIHEHNIFELAYPIKTF